MYFIGALCNIYTFKIAFLFIFCFFMFLLGVPFFEVNHLVDSVLGSRGRRLTS